MLTTETTPTRRRGGPHRAGWRQYSGPIFHPRRETHATLPRTGARTPAQLLALRRVAASAGSTWTTGPTVGWSPYAPTALTA